MPKTLKYRESETKGFERFMRICKIYDHVYYTECRTGKVCPKCRKPNIVEQRRKR